MKERDYIKATNLAKLRIAKEVLRSVIPITLREEQTVNSVVKEVALLEGLYERDVHTHLV